MPFDYAAAKRAGYTDAEIADYLSKGAMFDAPAARKAGYSDAEIVQHLQTKEAERASRDVIARDAKAPAKPAPKTTQAEADRAARSTFGKADPGVDTSTTTALRNIKPENPVETYKREQRNTPGYSISAPAPVEPGIGSIAHGLANTADATNEAMKQMISDAAPAPYLNPTQQQVAAESQMRDLQQAQGRADRERPQFDSAIASGVYGGFESVLQQLPGLAASVAAGNPLPSLAWAGATTGTQAYGKYRARGGTPGEAALGGIGEGAVEVATEMIPMGTFIDAMGGAKGAKSFFKEVGKSVLEEIPGEQIATLAQDAIDTAIANPNKTWGDYFAERPDAALQTLVATITQGAVMAGGGYAVHRSMQPRTVGDDGRISARPIEDTRVAAPGVRQSAEAGAAIPTQADIESPLDTADIVAGRTQIAKATGSKQADTALQQHGLPTVGSRVVVDMGDGQQHTGSMEDWFEQDDGKGVVIKLDNGKTMREFTDTLADAGVSIRPALAEADAIDAELAARAQAPLQPAVGQSSPVSSPATSAAPAAGRPRAGAASSSAIDSYMAKTRGAESGGNDSAKNPRSSAAGRYQFTDGTWLAYYKEEFGDDGKTAAQILALKSDPATQDRLMRRLTSDNAAALARAGHAVDDGNLYLAHFAGSAGANALLNADPSASAESILGARAIAANPFLKGKTAGEVVAWAHAKMGGAAPGLAAAQPAAKPESIDFAQPKFDDVKPVEVARREADQPEVRGEKIDDEFTAFHPTSGTLGIPRAEMPQIAAEHRGAMVNFLGARGITHEDVTVPAAGLKPTQAEFSEAKVQKAKDFTGGDRAILVSSDGYVLDGHHQWMAARDQGSEVRAIKLDAPIADLINTVRDMPSATTESGEKPAEVPADAAPVAQPATDAAAPARDPIVTGDQAAAPDTPATESSATFEVTPSGNGFAVIGASPAELAAIAAAVPKAKASQRKDGAQVYSAKYADEIRAAVAGVSTKSDNPDSRDGAAYSFNAVAGISQDETYALVREQAQPVEDMHGNPTGWLKLNLTNGDGALLIHGKRNESRKFTGKGWRQYAPGYAIDHADDAGPNEPKGSTAPSAASDAGKESAREQGAAAFAKGADRVPPSFLFDAEHKKAWLSGWDTANLAAPTPLAGAKAAAPSKNRLVTDERAAELRERLKAKLNPNRLNSGIDPEVLAIGTELAVYHIEKGARRFAALARAVAADLDMPLANLRTYLRGWYNGARDMMEDHGESVAGMDDSEEVAKAMRTFGQWADEPVTPPAANGTRNRHAELSDSLPAGDARPGAEDVSRAPQDGRDDRASGREGRGSAEAVQRVDGERGAASEWGDRGSATGSRSDRAGLRDPDNLPAERGEKRGAAADAVTGADWTIEPGSLAEERSPAQKARDNVDAIALVKQIEREGRPATRAEQAKIARYVGWGGLKNAFPDSQGEFGKGFETIGPELRSLLSDAEYETARRSIQYAHYTGETVVRAMWDIADRLGFRGGSVFEPGMGTGNFRGMMPPAIAAASHYNGIEYDHLTASIAKLLYPQSGVQQADYTRTPQLMDVADLVIGNPPFSETTVSSDPAYATQKFVLHDFFFAKSLDAVKPGGLLMFVTSAGTMNKVGDKARAWLADRADLVGAIRLPGNTFEKNAGTSVTTDIVILRKRAAGEPAGDRSWVETVNVPLQDRDGNTVEGSVNRYFVERPEMVLGEQGMFDKLVAGPRYAVRAPDGFDLGAALKAAADRLPAAILHNSPKLEPLHSSDLDFSSSEKKDGSYYVDPDGRLMQYRNGVGRPVQSPGKGVTGGMSAAAQERVRGLVPIRDALRDVYAADIKDDVTAGDKAREKLNKAYDAFVAKFGPINKTDISYRAPTSIQLESARAEQREEARLAGTDWDDGSFDIEPYLQRGASITEIARDRKAAREAAIAAGRAWNEGTFDPESVPETVIEKRPNLDPFIEDEESYRLAAIEHYNKDTGEAVKGKAFYENAVRLDRKPTINSAQDALLYSLNRLGRPDIGVIADMAGKSRGEVLEELHDQLFEVPGQPGAYETAETYLSGNVREKLALAQAEAKRNPALVRNVKALEAALPAPLTPSEISANLGMPWIPTEVIERFATEHMGLQSAKVKYLPKLAQWTAAGDTYSAAARSTWGTARVHAMDLLEAALNRQTPTVRDRTEDGKSVINAVATQAAQDKMAEIKAAFREWIWQDEARADRLTTLYNENYNSLVAPKFDGSYLTTPGIASGWEWRPHQRAVIARIIQAGNTYMAHEVGAGKTSAMIGAGMEMKRLGLVSKPMYVVPNHMLGQFTKEFYEQYPLAKIRVADETRFHTSRRKEFVARMAADDLDAVIITHSAFGYIPMSDDFTAGMIEDQIAELEDLLGEIGKDQDQRITRRKIEQQKEQLEQRLLGLTNRKRDQVFTFEETGVDFLFVDEAHLFRKLDFSTKMGNVKGIDPNGSQMSFDLFAKTRHLEEVHPGRNLVLASGTPITNTMAELYSVSRYLQQAELDKRGLGHFDAWAGAFGDTVTSLEQDPAGGYKPVTRFAQFVNVPELSVMVRQVMDVVGAAELRQYVTLPTLKGGSRQMVLAEQTPSQAAYQEDLKARMVAISKRSGPPQKGDDILLSVIGDGRKSAIDYRLIDAEAPKERGSKLEMMIDNVVDRYKEFARVSFHTPGRAGSGFSEKPVSHGRATQMIFSDFGINGAFPVHKYIKQQLVQRGIPASQVAIISDFKTHVAKQRLFNDMNEGKVAVLIGSVAKMGTGVNAQKRLRALHNMDAQWYPANDTQRNGRIIRQGNMNPEVEILDYSTKGTYDSQMWNLMAKKAKFIEGFMRGDPTMRDMEDLGEASQYEQAQAMTTSDPRVMELTEWKQDLEKLERRKVAHEREKQQIRSRIAYAKQEIEDATRLMPLIEEDIAKRVVPVGDEFTAKAGGQTFDDRAEFGAALLEAMDKLIERSGGKQDREGVGDLGGFPLVAEVHPGIDGPVASIIIKRAGGRETVVQASEDSRGLVTKLVNALKKFDSELSYEKSSKERSEREIADYTPRLSTTFDGGAQIEELRSKIGAMETTLDAETKAREAAAKAAQPTATPKDSVADGGPVATLTGQELGVEVNSPSDMPALRAAARDFYERELVGTTVTSSDGHPVEFNKRGMRKVTSKGPDLIRAVPAIRAIIERGDVIDSRPGQDPSTKAMHLYAGDVSIGGDVKRLGVFVRETYDGRFQYDLTAVNEGVGSRSETDGVDARAPNAPALEDTPDALNLFDVGADFNRGTGDMAALREDLRARLAKLGLADKVTLNVVDALSGTAEGRYWPGRRVIEVALGARDTGFVLDHEAVHALRDMGVFTQTDWKILTTAARNTPDLWLSVQKRYAGLPLAAREEEAVADLFGRYQRGDFAPKGMVERLFIRLVKVLAAVRNAFRGQGFTTPRTFYDVLGEVASGEAATREGQGEGGRAFVPAFGRKGAAIEDAKFSIPERDDMVALGGTGGTWSEKAGDAFDRWRTAAQDRYLPLLKVQREIEAQTGKSLPPSRNPYMAEELMTGRIGARLEKLAEDHVGPLFDAMHEAGVTIDELESYLYARHAPERNARMAELNPEFEQGEGSGMTDIEARAVMNRIRREGKMDAMERLAPRVDRIIADALDYRVETGLMSEEQAKEWRDTYEHYIPLRGFKETGGDPIPERMNRSGGGINVRGRESKAAYGRRSKADSPLAYIILQAEEAIVRGETNRVAQKFVALAKANPDPDFWAVNKVSQKRRINEESGLVESYLSRNLAAEDADWTVSAKIDGKEVRVTLNKANVDARRLADSMRNLTQHQLDWVTMHLGKVNRFLSAVNTSYNPEFVITNAFRDLQTAAFNLAGEDVKKLTRGVLRDYPAALKASTKGAFGKHDGEWGQVYDEFVANGGRVYFNQIENIDGIKKQIETAFAMSAAKAGDGGTLMQAKRGVLAVKDFIENLNNGVENAVRLATFKNARAAGLTPAQAASMAKNVTVNFNRRGTMGPAMNAAYLFFNASVQGSARIFKALRSPRVRKMMAGVMIASALVELLNAMVSGDDDDGESFFDKIPEFEKGRNMVFMLPNGRDYIKIPMPYGYNVFWNAGRTAAEIARRGGDRWKESTANFLSDALDAFNPVGGAGSLLNLIAPTVIDPLVDLTTNQDFTGRKIMPDQPAYAPPEPDNQRYWGSVGTHWRAISSFLNDVSGGDDVQPGAIDVSPETLEYMFGTVVGSAGAFLDRMAGLVNKGIDPDVDATANDLPFVRKVTGSKPAWYDKSAFYDRIGAVEQQVAYAKGYLDEGKMDEASAFVDAQERILSLEPTVKAAKREMRAIRKARKANDAAFDRGRIDDATHKAEKAVVDEAERQVVLQFNTRWNEVMTGGD